MLIIKQVSMQCCRAFLFTKTNCQTKLAKPNQHLAKCKLNLNSSINELYSPPQSSCCTRSRLKRRPPFRRNRGLSRSACHRSGKWRCKRANAATWSMSAPVLIWFLSMPYLYWSVLLPRMHRATSSAPTRVPVGTPKSLAWRSTPLQVWGNLT